MSQVPSLLSSNVVRVAGVVVGGTLAALLGVYRLAPGVVMRGVTNRKLTKTGLKRKRVHVADFDWEYLEGGEEHEETIVFIHGYTGSKEDFGILGFAGTFTDRYHVVVPDLPGHGATTPLDLETDYSFGAQAGYVESFVRAVLTKSGETSPRPFHLLGHSMGGAIVGVFAATRQSLVKTLCLVCPAGIRGEQLSGIAMESEERQKRGETPLLVPETFEQMKAMVMKSSVEPPAVPDHFLRYAFGLRIKRRDLHIKIYADLVKHGLHLHEVLESIRAPTLVLWGDKDYILHVSGADVLRKYIPTYTDVHIFKNKGHNLLFEALDGTSQAFSKFLTKYSSVAVEANDVL